jgi:beta-lactamase regulating signal transducer with metallopeptidase domain
VGVGTSLVLIGVGAILKYAITAEISGIDIEVVGTILLVLGVVGLLISLLYTMVWSDRGFRREREVVEEPARDRDRYYR